MRRLAPAREAALRAGWSAAFLLPSALAAQPYGLPGPRQPVDPYLEMPETPPQPSGAWTTEIAFPNLDFSNPVHLIQAPRSNRLYVCEREGRIQSFQNDPGTASKTLVLDISGRTQGWDDCGLMSLAFHSEFGLGGSPNRGYFYVFYQYTESPTSGPNRPPNTTPTFHRLARFTIPDGQFAADPGSELVLIQQHDRNVWHNGGHISFHPGDGFLYFAIGDEGGANDSYDVTQRINDKLLGGVFRIDVDMRGGSVSHPIRRQPQSYSGRPSFTANYYIPNDNPWQDAAGGVLEEFYALGVRSPHRLTHDPVRNILLLGDVGQGAWEEVDVIEKGKNYQWPYREGNHAGPKSKPASLIGVDALPLYEYSHGSGTFQGNCIIGGHVYRGSEHAASIGGKYIFGDNTFGRIWALDLDAIPPAATYLTNMPSGSNYTGLSSFGVDSSGELYLLKMNHTGPGRIYKLAREGSAGPPIPLLLSQTGAFTDVWTLAPASGLVPYDVGSPLWSDGAEKIRWMGVPYSGSGIPSEEKVQFAPAGEWTFPAGTVFVKHFELVVNELTEERRRLETRLLVRSPGGGVYGVTYKWRLDQSDADLLTEGLDEDIDVITPEGIRTQTWRYPSSAQCGTCHNAAAQFVLGVKTRQLNNVVLYNESGVADNQLRSLNHLGLLDPPLDEGDLAGYASLSPVSDTGASLEHRVRSYIDANCALCHRPGNVQAFFDARFDTPLEDQGLIDGSVGNSFGIDGAAVIKPKDIWRSLVHVRASSTLPSLRMPPLARNVPDSEALSVIAQWIDSLPGTPALAPPEVLPEGSIFEDSVEVSIHHPDPAAAIRYTLNGSDPTPVSQLYTGPFTLTDSATVTARAYRDGFIESVPASEDFTSASAGLLAQYYNNIDFTDPRLTRVDPAVDFDWGTGSPDSSIGADSFSVRWTGQVEALRSEAYTFYTVSDDGIRLSIDGQLIIDNWTDHPPTENSGVIALEAGRRHDVLLEFYENGGGAMARLLWSSPGTPRQVIPQARLSSGAKPSELDLDGLACARVGDDASLTWTNRGAYDEVRVYQNGQLVLTLAGSEEGAVLSLDGARAINRFRVASVVGGGEREGETCGILTLGGTYAAVIDEDFTPVPSAARLRANCDAAVRSGALDLTPPAGDLTGSAFFLQAHPDDEFIAEFDFSFAEPSAPGADGLAFIINTGGPTDICGAAGGAMGFRSADDGSSVYPGFAVVFDTWQNPGEVSHNWVGFVDSEMGGTAEAGAAVPEEFCGNGVFHATIVASQGAFSVLLENSSIGMAEREVLFHAVDGFTPSDAFFGFSAGTGGAWARHTVDNFKLQVLVDEPPAASFSALPVAGTAPLSVRFTSTSQGFIDSYLWDFGDGATSALPSPTHLYAAAGSYTVTLTVTGPGGSDDMVRAGYINVAAPEGNFIRGDSNGSTTVDISDGVFVLLHAFTGTVSTNCEDSLDADDSGVIGVTDAIRILRYIFAGGPAPAAPFPASGPDPTTDVLEACGRGL
jgi:uncharacterized repeat protein (TIGR03806 family)